MLILSAILLTGAFATRSRLVELPVYGVIADGVLETLDQPGFRFREEAVEGYRQRLRRWEGVYPDQDVELKQLGREKVYVGKFYLESVAADNLRPL